MGEKQKYLTPHVFKAVQEMKEHSERFYQKAESTHEKEMKAVYEEMVSVLDEMSDKILQVSKYDDNTLQKSAVVTASQEGLSSYTQLIVLYEYENGYALTEDTAGQLHMIEQKHLRYE